ncbi:MAG: PAS domain S-box protein [Candidatus Methylomirabilia bacterium]
MTKQQGRSSERRRHALWLTGGLLLVAGLLCAADWEADRQERLRLDAFHSRISDLAMISETIIDEQLHRFDDVLLVLRSVYATDPERFIESIALLRNGPLADRGILVVRLDRNGYLAYTDATTAQPGLYLGDRPYFRYFADGGHDRFYVEEPVFGRATQRYSVPLARPIYDRKGAFLGVLALSVRQDSLASFGPRLQLSGDTTVTLVTHSGAVAGRSRDLARVQGKTVPPEMLAAMLKGTDGVFSSRVIPEGDEQVVAYRHLHGIDTPLIVYVGVAPGTVLREVSLQRAVLMWGAVAISAVIMVLIVVYLRGRRTTAQLVDTLRAGKTLEYATLTRTSLDGFYITDVSARFLDCNDTLCAMLGHQREELLRMSVADVEASESRGEVAAHIRTVSGTGCARFSSRWRRKDGTVIDVEISAQYLAEEGGRLFTFVRDVTEHKRTGELLQATLRRLELALQTAKAGTWDWDVGGGRIAWSPEMFSLFGLEPRTATVSFEAWRGALHPEDRETAESRIEQALKLRTSLDSDYRVVLPGGTVRWINAVGRGVYDDQGRATHMIGMCQDITARKQAAEALIRSERILAETERIGKVGGWEMDIDTGNQVWTAEVYRIHEVDPTFEPTAGNGLGFYVPASRPIIEGAIRRAVEQGEPFDLELEIITAKSNRRFVHAIGRADLQHRRIFGFFQDITERKNAELQVRYSANLLANVSEAIVAIDRNFNVTYWNAAAERMYGWAAAEVLGKPFLAFIQPRYPGASRKAVTRTISQAGYWKGDLLHNRRDGTLFPVQVTISAVKAADGQVIGHVAINSDITESLLDQVERARLEDQLRQSQKVEAIGRLAGGVAHDFNNMTAIVLGYGDLLLGRLGPEDPSRKWAEQIVEAGRRSATLTRQLLAFSRRQVLLPVVLDLNGLLRNLESMLGRLIGEHIVLRFDLAGDLGRVTVDPGQIEQVVLNLAINARDAMPRGGNLVIETANVELDETYAKDHAETVPGDYVMLALTDTGCGMDKVHLARLFEPFFTTKEMGKGTGLGLATSYGIVKQSGGYIWAYSEPGRGTTFKIYLPRTDAQPAAPAADAGEEAPRGRGERILLVEDEASLREMWAIVLSRLGYRVSTAGSGPGALALIMETGPRPDLVITDVIMPCMSGAEMVQRFRKNWPDLKALFMSGYPDEAITSHGVLGPGISFLQKPFSERALARKVREVLGVNTAVAPPGRRVLMIDDDGQYRELVRLFCTKRGHAFAGVDSAAAALAALAGNAFDVLLVDMNIPGTGGEQVLREIRAAGHAAPAIVLTGDVSSADMEVLRPLGVLQALEKSSSSAPLLQAIEAAALTGDGPLREA